MHHISKTCYEKKNVKYLSNLFILCLNANIWIYWVKYIIANLTIFLLFNIATIKLKVMGYIMVMSLA